MIAGDAKVLKTVRSLMGHKTSLKCRVHHRAESAPNFKWYKKSTNEIITEGIITTVNTSTLTFEHVNATDFGEYICEAATKMVSVKQNFLVVKLGNCFNFFSNYMVVFLIM